jgi:hypothetical protein
MSPQSKVSILFGHAVVGGLISRCERLWISALVLLLILACEACHGAASPALDGGARLQDAGDSPDRPTGDADSAEAEAGDDAANGPSDAGSPSYDAASAMACPTAPATVFALDSPDGDVTAHEIDTFFSVLCGTAIPTSMTIDGGHNYLADFEGGETLEALDRMIEMTASTPSFVPEHLGLLNLAIRWNDAWLSHRNDLPLGEGRTMWTGRVEPVWPPDPAPSTYAGCEVGETVGLLAYTALNIVSSPSLSGQTIPDGDPESYGATYGERAATYVKMLEQSMVQFFNANFLDASNKMIEHPDAAAYDALASNNVNAWNRMMMFLHAYQTLGMVHAILGDAPSKAALYKSVTENTVNLFVTNAFSKAAPNGKAIFDWGYGNYGDVLGDLTGELTDAHGQWDMFGLERAFRAGYTTATAEQMATYGSTIANEIYEGPGEYSRAVDRSTPGTYTFLPAAFMYLSPYEPDIYAAGVAADLSSGTFRDQPQIAASVLWAKHAKATM